MAESRAGSVELTELVKYDLRFIWERLSQEEYDIEFLKRRGYTIKGSKVFAHTGAIISKDLGDAFRKLGFRPKVLRPKNIFVTEDISSVPAEAKLIEHFNRFFYADEYEEEKEESDDES